VIRAPTPLDGRSLVALWKGETQTLGDRALFWHFPAYLQSYKQTNEQRDLLFRTRPCSIIRRGRYKLHENLEDGLLELYDLQSDIRERHNLATSMPDQRDAMLADLREWQQGIGAPIPEPSSEFDAKRHRQAQARARQKAVLK
jgi:arylsulfatase A-like enzyme